MGLTSKFDRSTLKLVGIAGGSFVLSKLKTDWAQQFLFDNLQKVPGVPAKFSQWLGQKWEVSQEFNKPLMPMEVVQSLLESETPELFKQIKTISEQAWSASIGQVHQVVLADGSKLAVKIQYPGLAESVHAQIDQMIWLMEKSPAKKYGLDGERWRQDLHQMFDAELDYEGERLRQQKFIDSVGSKAWILVPRVYPEWSTKTILAQEFLAGEQLSDLLTQEKPSRELAARELVRLLIRSLLTLPVLHGDLQPKNWAWHSQDQKIILYDFGSCIDWSPERQRLVEALIDALRGGQHMTPLDYLVALGFEAEKLMPIKERLPILVATLLEPFWNGRLLKLSSWQVQRMIQEILGDQAWYFRTAGPPWFLWLMRSFASVFYAIRELNDDIAVAAIFEEEQSRLNADRWRGFAVSSGVETQSVEKTSASFYPQQAHVLKIHVTDGMEEVVALTFPIHTLQNLEDLIDDELMQKIREQNLDVTEIKQQAFRSGLIKQDLFKIKKGNRMVRIWIE